GPTWESASGSRVVGARVAGATADPNAIDWLLLRAVSSEGPGIFDGVTYIQRVNTVGGKAPTAPGDYVGEEVRVPYAAEYFFYRADPYPVAGAGWPRVAVVACHPRSSFRPAKPRQTHRGPGEAAPSVRGTGTQRTGEVPPPSRRLPGPAPPRRSAP